MTGDWRYKPRVNLAGRIDQIVHMHEKRGLNFAEIAKALGASKQGVQKAYQRHVESAQGTQ